MRTHVGPHRVQLWIGSGGDAEVWAAEEALTGARIAVKVMKGEPSSGRVGRLIREYQYLRMLSVPGVPRARGLGVDDDGLLFLVMDLVDGVSGGFWAERIASEHKDDRSRIVSRMQRMLVAAASLLQRVHDSGLVHGDVKPSCFLVGASDAVSLVDFGASRPIESNALSGKIDEAFGTAAYSAIECLSKAPPTVASDAWSFAASAFRMLTGEYAVRRGSRAELRAQWQNMPSGELAERLARACPELPAGARDALLRGFSVVPEERPSAHDLALALAEGALAEAPLEQRHTRSPRHASQAEPDKAGLEAQLVALLRVAGAPVSPRVLARAVGRSTRRVLSTLERAQPAVQRSGTLRWTLPGAPVPVTELDPAVADALAEALVDEPVGPARVRALAAAARREEMLEAFERWVAALAGSGQLAQALPVLHALSGAGAKGFEARLALVRARAAVAGPALDVALDTHLESIAAADPLLAPALERARWTLARHFETFHVSSRPGSLAVAWRAHALGELDAALASAETALDEARWMRQGDVEADALMLMAQVHGARGATLHACRLAAEAIDRWPSRAPGIGGAVALLARLRLQSGAWSEARRLVATRAPEAPTVVDRAHLLLVTAELELTLEHDAVVDDALAAVDALLPGSGPHVASIEARLAALRLSAPGQHGLRERCEDAERLLTSHVDSGLALHVPVLGVALAHALFTLRDGERARNAANIALQAADFMRDLPGRLAAFAALARVEPGAAHGDLADALLNEAGRAGLWPGQLQLALMRGDHATARVVAKRILPNLDLADANALSLMPWAVEANS